MMDFRSNEADRIALKSMSDAALPFEQNVPAISRLSLVVTTPGRGSWSFAMDYAKPADVVASMVDASSKKLALGPRDLLIRGALSGGLLGAATVLAFTGAVTTGQPIVGALIFPVSLVMIVLLGLELVTGSFALVPLARFEGKAGWGAVVANWSFSDWWLWNQIPVTLGNLVGGFVFTGLALYATYKPQERSPAAQAVAVQADMDSKVLAS
jgi:formate/nitrite transporter FocA (FNT family)